MLGILAAFGAQQAPTARPQPMQDGRIVAVSSSRPGQLSADAVARIQSSFNRRLTADLRTYRFGEIVAAAEAAADEGVNTPNKGGQATARTKVHVIIECCPLRITIEF